MFAALLISHKCMSLVGIYPLCGEFSWTKTCKKRESVSDNSGVLSNVRKYCLHVPIDTSIQNKISAEGDRIVNRYWWFNSYISLCWSDAHCRGLVSVSETAFMTFLVFFGDIFRLHPAPQGVDKPLTLMTLSLSGGVVKMGCELYKTLTHLQTRVKFSHSTYITL